MHVSEKACTQAPGIDFMCLHRMGVNMEQETMSVLSPAPGPLPRKTLLFSDVKFVDIR